MLAVLITLTTGRRNEFIHCQMALVRIALPPILDVNTWWNSTLYLLKRPHRLLEFTREWLQNPNFTDYWPLVTTQDECTMVKYAMQVWGAISILDCVDVKEAYSHIPSRYHSVQRHVRSHWRRDESFGQQDDLKEGRLVLRCEVSSTEAVQKLPWRDSNDGHAADFCTYPQFFSEVGIV